MLDCHGRRSHADLTNIEGAHNSEQVRPKENQGNQGGVFLPNAGISEDTCAQAMDNLREIVDAEYEKMNSMPESLLGSERAAKMQEGINSIESLIDSINELSDALTAIEASKDEIQTAFDELLQPQ